MVPSFYFAVLWEDKKGRVLIRFPQHPLVHTFGRDLAEATAHAKEALNLALEADFERGYRLPPPSRPRLAKGERLLSVPLEPNIRTAYLLREWREEAGLTQTQLALRLGISYQAYQRMERPGRSNLTVATLDRIAQALGHQLLIAVQ
jgi:DNA-binding XRE family transcriptional regulator/predicted RNase H-like HicB family nuclease